MTTTNTPRTDKETWETIAGAFKCSGANGDLEGKGEYVKASFARQLETELAEANAKVALLRKEHAEDFLNHERDLARLSGKYNAALDYWNDSDVELNTLRAEVEALKAVLTEIDTEILPPVCKLPITNQIRDRIRSAIDAARK